MAEDVRAQEDSSARSERGWLTLGALLGGVALTALAILGGWIALTPYLYPKRFDRFGLELAAVAGGTVLVVAAVFIAVIAVRKQRDRDDTYYANFNANLRRANIEGYYATFNECVRRGEATDPESIANRLTFITGVRGEFQKLRDKVSVENDDEINEILEDSAEELERLRAYIIPPNEILADGQTKLADMYEWGVPSTVLDKLTEETVPMLKGSNEARARAALRTIYENYDYWDDYVEYHAIWMRAAGGLMLGIMLASLTGAVMLVHVGHVYSGAFCGGLAGALLSVVAKLPPVLGYGATNAYVARIMSRVGVGVAASMIGIGLLASDIITINVPVNGDRTMSFADMLDGKDRRSEEPPVLAQPTPNDTIRQEGGPLKQGPYSRRSVLLILAVAMLFGFSERALSTFEDKILPARVVVAEDGQRPPGNGGGGDGRAAPIVGAAGAVLVQTQPPPAQAPPTPAPPAPAGPPPATG